MTGKDVNKTLAFFLVVAIAVVSIVCVFSIYWSLFIAPNAQTVDYIDPTIATVMTVLIGLYAGMLNTCVGVLHEKAHHQIPGLLSIAIFLLAGAFVVIGGGVLSMTILLVVNPSREIPRELLSWLLTMLGITVGTIVSPVLKTWMTD